LDNYISALDDILYERPLAIPIISEGKKYWIKGFLKKLNPIIRGGGEAYSTFAYCLTSRAIDIAAIQSLLRK